MNHPVSLLILPLLAAGLALSAQEEDATPPPEAPEPAPVDSPRETPPPEPPPEPETGNLSTGGEPRPADPPEIDAESKTLPSGKAAENLIPEAMAVFRGHAGKWKGLTETSVTEKGEKTLTKTRSQWVGTFLLGGHSFEIRGHSDGELGPTQYRWHYTYDGLKRRYMAAYSDSHGRTQFFEGKVDQEKTRIIWRLIAPPGDMTWHAETDLQPEDSIETSGQIKSEEFDYDMIYTSVFRRP